MQFQFIYQPSAEATLIDLEQTDPKKYRKVLKTLALMESNLRLLQCLSPHNITRYLLNFLRIARQYFCNIWYHQ